MSFECCYLRRVEFHETDLAGIVHFSNYFRYMEAAEHAFIRSLGLAVHGAIDGQLVSFPRVDVQCRYESPLRFEDEIEIHLLVAAKRRSSITYRFDIRKSGSEKRAARGTVTAVCVAFDPQTKTMAAISIPESIDRLIEVAPAALLADPDDQNRT
jgi:acyl-CoA thioester hydrolase